MTISRRSFVERLSFGTGGALLSSLVGGFVREARGQIATRKRVVIVIQGNSFNAARCFTPADVPRPPVSQSFETTRYSLPAMLAPLAPYRDRMLLVDGLRHRDYGYGIQGPPGSAHSGNFATLTSVHPMSSPGGMSFDQYLAGTLGAASPFRSVLLAGTRDPRDALTNQTLCARGPGQPLPLQASPQEAFRSVFGGRVAGSSGSSVDTQRLLALKRRSVFDFMLDDIKRAQAALGPAERAKLDEYLTSIRAVEETRSKLDQQMQSAPACAAPSLSPSLATYEERIAAHFEVATLALKCNLTQVVVLSAAATDGQFAMNYTKLFPSAPTDPNAPGNNNAHTWGHVSDSAEGISKYNVTLGYHAGLIAKMVKDLSAAMEGDKSVFANTVVFWASDGGANHHSERDRWPIVVVGNAGGALRSDGRYLTYPYPWQPNTRQRSATEFFWTIAKAVGFPTTTFAANGFDSPKAVLSEILA